MIFTCGCGGLGGRVLTSFRIRGFVLSMLLLLLGFPVHLCLCDSLCPDSGWESTIEGRSSSCSVISELDDSWLLSQGFFCLEQKKNLHLVSSFSVILS